MITESSPKPSGGVSFSARHHAGGPTSLTPRDECTRRREGFGWRWDSRLSRCQPRVARIMSGGQLLLFTSFFKPLFKGQPRAANSWLLSFIKAKEPRPRQMLSRRNRGNGSPDIGQPNRLRDFLYVHKDGALELISIEFLQGSKPGFILNESPLATLRPLKNEEGVLIERP